MATFLALLVVPGDAAGYWPLLANRLAATLTIAALAVPLHWSLSLRWPLVPATVLLGVAALLGIYVLRERLSRPQAVGLAAAGAAVALIALG